MSAHFRRRFESGVIRRVQVNAGDGDDGGVLRCGRSRENSLGVNASGFAFRCRLGRETNCSAVGPRYVPKRRPLFVRLDLAQSGHGHPPGSMQAPSSAGVWTPTDRNASLGCVVRSAVRSGGQPLPRRSLTARAVFDPVRRKRKTGRGEVSVLAAAAPSTL